MIIVNTKSDVRGQVGSYLFVPGYVFVTENGIQKVLYLVVWVDETPGGRDHRRCQWTGDTGGRQEVGDARREAERHWTVGVHVT